MGDVGDTVVEQSRRGESPRGLHDLFHMCSYESHGRVRISWVYQRRPRSFRDLHRHGLAVSFGSVLRHNLGTIGRVARFFT